VKWYLNVPRVFCMWPMQGAFHKHLELLTHASLILPRVTQTIINNISVCNFINL